MRMAVVTGGAGFLGSHLCEALVERGYRVVCLDNLLTGSAGNLAGLSGEMFEFREFDITEPVELEGKADLVFHFASPASPQDYLRYPVETLRAGSIGTLNALELARRHEARFLLASTSEVYGDPARHPQPETYWGNVNPVGPRSSYDEAKRFAEAAVTAYRNKYAVNAAIVRIFNTFGPRMRAGDGRLVPNLVNQALTGAPLTVTGDGSQTRSLLYVDDLVEGVLRLADSGEPGPVNIGGVREMTVLHIAELVRDLAGGKSAITFLPAPTDDPARRRPDITLAGNLLGWTPRTELKEGLLRTIEWFRCL
jgi:dTDP-glucose 4,6-dehydratase